MGVFDNDVYLILLANLQGKKKVVNVVGCTCFPKPCRSPGERLAARFCPNDFVRKRHRDANPEFAADQWSGGLAN